MIFFFVLLAAPLQARQPCWVVCKRVQLTYCMHVCLFSLYRGREPRSLPIFCCTAKMCCWTDGKRREVKQTEGQQIHGAPSFSHPPPPQPTFTTEKAAPQNSSGCVFFFPWLQFPQSMAVQQPSQKKQNKTNFSCSQSSHDIVSLSRASKSLRNRVCVSEMLRSIPTDQIKWISLIMSGWVRN